MPELDHDKNQIDLHVLVLGAATDAFLAAVSSAKRSDHAAWGPVHTMTLGQVRGWNTLIHFHGVGADPWAGDGAEGARVEKLAPLLDALVLTDAPEEGKAYSSIAVERLARLLSPAKTSSPSAIFGSDALAQEWATLSAHPPLFVGAPSADQAMPAVKEITKAMLRAMQS